MQSHNLAAVGTVIVCPICTHLNESVRFWCTHCWARLSGVSEIPRTEGEKIYQRYRTILRRWRVFRWGVFSTVLLALLGWIAFENIGTTRFLPPATTTISSASMPGEWAMFQRDPSHSGYLDDDTLPPQGVLKWRFQTSEAIYSSPAVVDGRVYITTGDRRIISLHEESGEIIWERVTNGPVNSSPAIAGDYIFYGLRDGMIVALRRETGEYLWSFRTGNYVFSSPAVYDGVSYLGSGDGLIYAFDAETGTVRWTYDVNSPILTAPAVNDEVVVVVSASGVLHIVDTDTGNLRLDYKLMGVSIGSPAIKQNLVYVADERGSIRAIDWRKRILPFEKTARWIRTQLFFWGMVSTLPPQKGFVWAKYFRGEGFSSTPAVGDETIYIGSTSKRRSGPQGVVRALDRITGEVKWEFLADKGIRASVAVSKNNVYVGDSEGMLYAIDVLSGKQQWRFQTGARIDGSPAIANSTLFLTSRDGHLYAIK